MVCVCVYMCVCVCVGGGGGQFIWSKELQCINHELDIVGVSRGAYGYR